MLVVVYTNSGGKFRFLSMKRKCQDYFYRKPRVKGLSRRNVEPTFREGNLRTSTGREDSSQKNFLGRLFDKGKRQTKPSNYDVSKVRERSTGQTSSESPQNLSNLISSELFNDSNQQFSVKRLNKSEKPTEPGNALIKLPIESGNSKTNPSNQNSAVTVRKINKSTKLDEENKNSDDATENDEQTIPSTSTPTTKTDPIIVTKIPRNRDVSTDVRHSSRQPSVTVKSLRRNRSVSHDAQKNSINGVNVTKIYKKPSKK